MMMMTYNRVSEYCFKNYLFCTILGLVLIHYFVSDIVRILYTLRQCVKETFKNCYSRA